MSGEADRCISAAKRVHCVILNSAQRDTNVPYGERGKEQLYEELLISSGTPIANHTKTEVTSYSG